MKRSKKVQFYAVNPNTGVRGIMSFKVENKVDARKALSRFRVPAGWYVEKDKYTGVVYVNEKIYPL